MYPTQRVTFFLVSLLPLAICIYVSQAPENQSKFVGETAIFECSFFVNGALFGPSYWEYKLAQDSEFREITHELQNFTLLSGGHNGHIECRLNEVTRADHNLTIRCGLSNLRLEAYLFVYSAPVLYLREDWYEGVQGGDLVVTFSTGGYPDPSSSDTFEWFHNSQPLEDSYSTQLTSVSLNITGLQSSDTGTYTLATHTAAGNATADFYIDVVYPPQTGPGTLFAPEAFAAVGGNVTLSCGDIQANPAPATEWFKDNSSLSRSDPLSLTDLSLRDSGLYICNASNRLGSVTTEVQLLVYGPASAPVWEVEMLQIRATEVLFVWAAPVETYGLEVDSYELDILSLNTSIQVEVPGDDLSSLVSYENGQQIYPDTAYTAFITALTYSKGLRGNSSLPLDIRTPPSPPVLSSLTSHITSVGIHIAFLLYSSGLVGAGVDYYQIELRSLTDEIIAQTDATSYIADRFESHSTYSVTVFGSRGGTGGQSLQTEIYTEGYGLPPTPALVQTEQIEFENRTNIIFHIARVSPPYMEFSVRVSCEESNSPLQISVMETFSGFEGGNMSLILNRTKISSSYTCVAALWNYFGNKTVVFSHTGPNINQITTTTTTTTAAPTSITTYPKPFTPFYVALVVAMALLLLLSICIMAVIVVVVYLCLRNYFHESYRPSSSLDGEKGKVHLSGSNQGCDYKVVEVDQEPSNQKGVNVANKCETTSV